MNEQTPAGVNELVDENRLLKQRLELAERTSIALRASLDLKADLLIKANTERDYFRSIAHDLVSKAEMISTLTAGMVQASASNARAMVPPEPPPTEPVVVEPLERLDLSQLPRNELGGGAGAPVDLDEARVERDPYQRPVATLR